MMTVGKSHTTAPKRKTKKREWPTVTMCFMQLAVMTQIKMTKQIKMTTIITVLSPMDAKYFPQLDQPSLIYNALRTHFIATRSLKTEKHINEQPFTKPSILSTPNFSLISLLISCESFTCTCPVLSLFYLAYGIG